MNGSAAKCLHLVEAVGLDGNKCFPYNIDYQILLSSILFQFYFLLINITQNQYLQKYKCVEIPIVEIYIVEKYQKYQ